MKFTVPREAAPMDFQNAKITREEAKNNRDSNLKDLHKIRVQNKRCPQRGQMASLEQAQPP